MTLSINNATDANEGLAEKIERIMQANGFTSVKIRQNDTQAITVDGRIGNKGKVTVRIDWNDDKRYLLLSDVYKGTDILWKKIDVDDLDNIINAATNLVHPKEENRNITESRNASSHKNWRMNLVLAGLVLIAIVSGVYLGRELRTYCQLHQEQIR